MALRSYFLSQYLVFRSPFDLIFTEVIPHLNLKFLVITILHPKAVIQVQKSQVHLAILIHLAIRVQADIVAVLVEVSQMPAVARAAGIPVVLVNKFF